jgi:hypothetical protein
MATKTTKKNTVSKKKLAEAAVTVEATAIMAEMAGAEDAAQGAAEIDLARNVAREGAATLASGVGDLTRAVDANLMAARTARLSEAVAEAGIADMAQGAEMLAASNDVDVMSAIVGLMGVEDFENGLELARLSGELETISDVLERLQLPVLAALLDDRGERLQSMAVESIVRAGSSRGLSEALFAAGKTINDLGENEMAEGVARLAVSAAAAEESEELAETAEILAMQGADKLEEAELARQLAREIAEEGLAGVTAGAAELGAAAALDETAQALDEAARK